MTTRACRVLLVGACAAATAAAPPRRADERPASPPDPAPATQAPRPTTFPVGEQRIVATRPDASTFKAVVFYPAASAGAGSAVAPSAPTLAPILFAHGYVQGVDRYRLTLGGLAAAGYLVVFPETQTGLFPSYADHAADLIVALDRVLALNAEAGSFLHKRVRTDAAGVMGHSTGGAIAVLAAARDQRFRAVAPIALSETDPSSAKAAAGLKTPMLIIEGSEDRKDPPEENADPVYAAFAGPKQYVLIKGAAHCGFMDSWKPFCDEGSLPRERQIGLTLGLLRGWFDLYVRGDDSAHARVWEAPPRDPAWSWRGEPGWGAPPVTPGTGSPPGR